MSSSTALTKSTTAKGMFGQIGRGKGLKALASKTSDDTKGAIIPSPLDAILSKSTPDIPKVMTVPPPSTISPSTTTPFTGIVSNANFAKVDKILKDNDYTRLDSVQARDSSGVISVYFIKAFDPNGVIVYVSLTNYVGELEIPKTAQVMDKVDTSPLPTSYINGLAVKGVPTLSVCDGYLCATIPKDDGSVDQQIFKSDLVQSANPIEVDKIINYPIIFIENIKDKNRLSKNLELYNKFFNDMNTKTEEAINNTINKLSILYNDMVKFKDNKKTLFETIKNDRGILVNKLSKMDKETDEAKQIRCSLFERNGIVEDYIKYVNQFVKLQAKIKDMVDENMRINNEMVFKYEKNYKGKATCTSGIGT